MRETERAVEKGTSIKSAEEKLYLVQNKVHVLKDKEANVINNFDKIVKVAEDLYSELHSSRSCHATLVEITSEENAEVQYITTGDVRKAIEGMSRDKTSGEDVVQIGLKINRQKTKIMLNHLAKEQEFKARDKPLECVSEHVCLGQLLTGKRTHEKEIPRRIRMG